MELSTQMLLFDAIQKGLNVDILDENDQFLKLWHGHHVEYVKNSNMTSKDNLSSLWPWPIKQSPKVLAAVTFLFRLEQSFLP